MSFYNALNVISDVMFAALQLELLQCTSSLVTEPGSLEQAVWLLNMAVCHVNLRCLICKQAVLSPNMAVCHVNRRQT